VADAPPCGEGAKPTQYTWPVPDVRTVCQEFGVPVDYQTCGFHTGTDICASSTGPDILSIADGRVVYVGPLWLQGADVGRGDHAVVVQHSPQFYSTYSHNQSALVGEGDCVERGQHIAELGDEGYSYGPHLHIEILSGTSFTGDWVTPFQNACSHYEDLRDYANP
jgi:murein DD-endopeptidase MepM/ murein hydrolase activator NlpD